MDGSEALSLIVVIVVDSANSLLQHKADDKGADDTTAIYIAHGLNIRDFLHDFTSSLKRFVDDMPLSTHSC